MSVFVHLIQKIRDTKNNTETTEILKTRPKEFNASNKKQECIDELIIN